MGVIKGDGTLYRNKRAYIVEIYTKNPYFASLVIYSARKISLNPLPYRKNKGILIRIISKYLYTLAKKIKEEVYEIDQKYFIRGLFDSDGFVSTSIQEKRIKVKVGLVNKDLELLRIVDRILKENFGIKSKIRINTKKGTIKKIGNKKIITKSDIYSLLIESKRDCERFEEKIGFGIPEKILKLRIAISMGNHKKSVKIWNLLFKKYKNKWVFK